MKEHLGKSQKGSVSVIIALLLPVLLGCVGMALDIGNLVFTKTRLRNAIDAAVCAGAMQLPNQSQAMATATSFLASNGFPAAAPTITFTQDTVKNPNNSPEINISVTQSVPTNFMGIFGSKSVNLTVAAEAVYSGGLTPPFTYNLFSVRDLSMNGSEHVQGSIHTDGVLNMNGSEVIGGNVEGLNGINMNGSEHVTGYAQANTLANINIHGSEKIDGGFKAGATNITMPDFSQQIIAATQFADMHTGPYTFNGSDVHGGTIYVTGDLTINGNISWTGSILATGNITINGSSRIQGSNQIFLYSSGGNITMNGSCSFGTTTASCIAYAPSTDSGKGVIIINGSSTWYGRVIGNLLTINGSGNFDGSNVNNVRSLPYGVGGGHAKIIS